MSNTISSYGTPNEKVFGKLEETIGTDDGNAFYKKNYDTLNVGWTVPITPTLTPTPTPTPTPIPYQPNDFLCTSLIATGSTKCNNELKLQWSTSDITNISCFATWSRAATPNDPINIIGFLATSSLRNGETSYGPFSKINVYIDTFNFGISRPSSSLDSGSIQVSTFGLGKIKSARLFGYSTGSSPLVLKVDGITGNYIYHSRNSSGNLYGGTGGFISSVISQSYQQEITASITSPLSTHILEIISYNDTLTFTPIEIKECIPNLTYPVSQSRIWINYDNLGKAEASWIPFNGANVVSRSFSGTPYSVCPSINGICIITGSLSLIHGSNYRNRNLCSDSDPRTLSRQIDVTTNTNGEYNFNYLDPYGVNRNASGTGSPSTKVYGVVCGYSIVSSTRGSPEISSRLC